MTTATLVPPELLGAIVGYFNPQRVILFGPHARGESGPDSDIDLLVIVDDDTPPEKVTLRAGFESHRTFYEAVDVVPVRAETFRRNAQIAGTVSRAAALDGVVVYERP
jgi:predicted nucleotidyltransferase